MWTMWTTLKKKDLECLRAVFPVHIGSKKCGPDVDQCGPMWTTPITNITITDPVSQTLLKPFETISTTKLP